MDCPVSAQCERPDADLGSRRAQRHLPSSRSRCVRRASDDNSGSGGGTRTPDTRIMMPGLCPEDQNLDRATRVKPASEDQKLSGILSNRSVEVDSDPDANSTLVESSSHQRVRQPGVIAHVTATPTNLPSPPAHPSNRLIAQLNERWRIVDDPSQWILQRRKGNPRKKNSGWQDRSFCTTREALLRCVREYCGVVDENALVDLQALPEHHEQPK